VQCTNDACALTLNLTKGDALIAAPKTQRIGCPRGAEYIMTQPDRTLADIETEARHMQAQAVASMFAALAARLRAAFASAPMNTGTGRSV
jgi:hypothetical protein